ncbi:hypothetical protein DN069_20940 [Streptacidiphilus pinicola]|uniref:Calcium-binding protein n=1 Tax=Streptacidiphilus pinicola TaxID=2219663 RepID=A0A2X0IGG3_9ACTN|nr:hypothetical protein [Streptacidiphilus pinicola]RAG83627.1 hypothetical protein DN069_20940 [Streptacidiphilus pinicola]
MKLRTSVATAVAATAAVLAVGAAPANAATTAKVNPQLSISASTTNATYGQWVTLTAHLGKTASNRTVTIYRSPAGETTQVVKSGKVDRYGNLRTSVWMGRNTGFTVRFAGDSRDNAAARGVYVHDAAVMHQWMTQGTYSAGQKPTIEGYVSPNKAGESVYAHLQVWYQGRWQTLQVTPSSFQLSSNSSFKITTSGLPAGYSFRQTFTFNGDALNGGSGYHWVYFKTA